MRRRRDQYDPEPEQGGHSDPGRALLESLGKSVNGEEWHRYEFKIIFEGRRILNGHQLTGLSLQMLKRKKIKTGEIVESNDEDLRAAQWDRE